jgi:dTDP-glucose 4,6-dehydratase
MNNILVTGGCGFLGINFIKYLFDLSAFKGNIVNIDKLTYAAQPGNLKDIEYIFGEQGSKNYTFIKGDINDRDLIEHTLYTHKIDVVVNFAAESSVDKSLLGAGEFLNSNIIGVYNLLESCKAIWGEDKNKLLIQIGTDECWIQEQTGTFSIEDSPYNPHNIYAATKASADYIAMSYFHTHGIPVILTHLSNNYGPYQHNEKFIPTVINNIINRKEIPVYGNGKNMRQWLFVEDTCEALWLIILKGIAGESYNIGGAREEENIELVKKICDLYDELCEKQIHNIRFVEDRKGHDFRYCISYEKIKEELGWIPTTKLKEGLIKTIKYYKNEK